MKLTKTLFILLFTALLCACGNNAVRHELQDIESYIQERPDSALASIRAIDTNALSSKSLKAHYSLLHAMALDKNYIDTADTHVIKTAIDYYDTHGDNSQKARAYYYLGRIQENGKKKTDAMSSYTLALDLINTTDDYHYKSLINSTLSVLYANEYSSETALKHAKTAYEYSKLTADTTWSWRLLGWIAECHGNNRERREADSLYKVFFSLPIRDSAFYARRLFNYAKLLVGRPPFDAKKSIELFDRAKQDFKSVPSIYDYYTYAYALELSGRTRESENLTVSLRRIDSNSIAANGWLYYINKHRKNYKEALSYIEKSIVAQDSVIISNLQQSLQNVQKDYFERKSLHLEVQKKAVLLKYYVVILMLILITVGTIVIVHSLRGRWKNRLEQINLLKEEVDNQLNSYKEENDVKDAKLLNLRQKYLSIYKNQYQLISHLCAAYLSPGYHPQDRIFNEVKGLLKEISEDNEIPSRAEMEVNRGLDNIMDTVREEFPSFKEKDYRLIAFFMMGFEAKAIAPLLDYSVKTVYCKKDRLKKRINKSNAPHKDNILELIG